MTLVFVQRTVLPLTLLAPNYSPIWQNWRFCKLSIYFFTYIVLKLATFPLSEYHSGQKHITWVWCSKTISSENTERQRKRIFFRNFTVIFAVEMIVKLHFWQVCIVATCATTLLTKKMQKFFLQRGSKVGQILWRPFFRLCF